MAIMHPSPSSPQRTAMEQCLSDIIGHLLHLDDSSKRIQRSVKIPQADARATAARLGQIFAATMLLAYRDELGLDPCQIRRLTYMVAADPETLLTWEAQ